MPSPFASPGGPSLPQPSGPDPVDELIKKTTQRRTSTPNPDDRREGQSFFRELIGSLNPSEDPLWNSLYSADRDASYARYRRQGQGPNPQPTSQFTRLLQGLEQDLYLDYLGGYEELPYESFKAYLEHTLGDDPTTKLRELSEHRSTGYLIPNIRVYGR